MDNIILAPFAQRCVGKINAKHYPYWEEVVDLIKDKYHLIQLGTPEDEVYCEDFRHLNLMQIEELLKECKTFITTDSFLTHLAHRIGKRGIVIYGISDPLLFGYPENINLLKDRKYLRELQFWPWPGVKHSHKPFVDAQTVANALKELLPVV
jgi:ADP-heptose:LPS heptosyltransferase